MQIYYFNRYYLSASSGSHMKRTHDSTHKRYPEPPEGMSDIRIRMERDFDDFNSHAARVFVTKIATLLSCDADSIQILALVRGCVIADLRLPAEEAQLFLTLWETLQTNTRARSRIIKQLKTVVAEECIESVTELRPYEMFVAMKKIPQDKAIVFLHGWRGSQDSFGDMPQYIHEATKCKTEVFSYPTGIWSHSPSMILIADAFRNWIMNNLPEHEIAMIAHSFGGLVTRQYIVSEAANDETRLDRNIRGACFLASPHDGAEYAHIASKIPTLNSAQIQDLNPKSAMIYQLNRGWSKWVNSGGRERCKIVSIFGTADKVVGAINTDSLSHETVPVLGRTHSSIIEPQSGDDEVIQTIVRIMREIGFADK